MHQRLEHLLSYSKVRLVPKTLIGLLVLVAGVLAAIAVVLFDTVTEKRVAASDNTAWNIVQFEVDYRDFLLAILRTETAVQLADSDAVENQLVDMRLEFDIFYSRIRVFLATLSNHGLSDVFAEDIDRIIDFREETAEIVDNLSLNNITAADITALRADVEAFEPRVRQIGVASLQQMVIAAEEAREQERVLLTAFLTVCLTALTLIVGAVIVGLRLHSNYVAQQGRIEQTNALAVAAFETTSTAILVFDENDRILLANNAVDAVFEKSPVPLIGESIQDHIVPNNRRRAFAKAKSLLSHTKPGNAISIGPANISTKRSDGSEFIASVTMRSAQTMAGQRLVVMFVSDITAAIAAEKRLTDALASAEANASAQQRLLATMSHEMRTPLHGIRLVFDLLAQDALAPHINEIVLKGRRYSDLALYHADFVLDSIRLTEIEEQAEEMDPVALLYDIIDNIVLTQHNGAPPDIRVNVHGAPSHLAFMGKPKAFTRALANIIGNSVKFAPGAPIDVSLQFEANTTAHKVDLIIEIIDHGPGIPPEDIDRLFKAFERGTDAHDTAGFGLGLYIVKQAVDLMDGVISVASQIGKGCKFSVCVPMLVCDVEETPEPAKSVGTLYVAPPSAPNATPAQSMAAMNEHDEVHYVPNIKRVLVVDDAPLNRELVATILKKRGLPVDVAEDGQVAVEMAKQHRYDVIFMDCYMPRLNGPDATAIIRREGPSRDAWIVGITARVDAETADNMRRPGMNDLLIKPFGWAEIDAVLEACACRDTEGAPDKATTDEKAFGELAQFIDLCGHDVGYALVNETLSDGKKALRYLDSDVALAIDCLHRAAGAASMGGLRELGRSLSTLEEALSDVGKAPLVEIAKAQVAVELHRAAALVASAKNA